MLCSSNCTAQPYSFTITQLVEGAHSVVVAAADDAGNSATNQFLSWVVDTTPPVVALATVPGSLAEGTAATFTVSCADANGCTLAYYLYSGVTATVLCSSTCTTQSWSFTLTQLVEGTHTIVVTGVDDAGNFAANQSYSWTACGAGKFYSSEVAKIGASGAAVCGPCAAGTFGGRQRVQLRAVLARCG